MGRVSNPAIRKRCLEWKLTAPEKRQPLTITELAKEVGLDRSTVGKYLQTLPDNAAEIIREAEIASLEHYPAILAKLVELAMSGDREASKVFLKEIASNYRQSKTESKRRPEVRLNVAVGLLPTSTKLAKTRVIDSEVTQDQSSKQSTQELTSSNTNREDWTQGPDSPPDGTP